MGHGWYFQGCKTMVATTVYHPGLCGGYACANTDVISNDTDFETALMPAIQGYFPNTRVQGCYFHFCQAAHRNVGELGLKTRYRTEEETEREIRMHLATTFLPVPQVDTGDSLLEAGIENGKEKKLKIQMKSYKNS
ncbi:hypothetical protein T4C_11705 [Trichinella pseudospiralis]|uniref:MULE transposase domain-containing protein n=1 Tax=Trichinella pseudospiralis TaxID=6337 RepID=A0A0V1IQR7_TRIPS|nr:hypothetical protein T4C_11705 [Trichinella pseudospiralis]